MDTEQEDEIQPRLAFLAKPGIPKMDENVWSSQGNCVEVYAPTTITESENLKPQILAAVVAASFHIVVGVALAYSAILIPQLEADDSDIKVNENDSAWLASVLVLVVPIGALLAGIAMEYMGRLKTIVLASLPCLLGWVLIATATNFTMILCGRLLTGVSAGLGTSPAVVYITEIAKPELRGSLISICPTLTSLGMVLIYSEGAHLSWWVTAWINLLYIILPVLLVYMWIPESPVWLVARGNVDKAELSLEWLAGKHNTVVKQQLASMVKSQDMKAIVAHSLRQRLSTFLRPAGYKPLLILVGLFVIQQFSGIYITLFYAVNFFQDAGSNMDPSLATILVGTVRFLMSLCNTALLKKFGRRPLCMLSGCGMAICMSVSGFYSRRLNSEGESGSSVPVVCMLLYVCTSMLGLLSIPWTMTAELFPTEIRGLAHGVVISAAHLIMFGAILSYHNLLRIFGGSHGMQWFFAAVSLLGVLFVWIFLPETHGVELTQIEKYFNENTFYIGQKKKKKSRPLDKDTTEEVLMVSTKI